MADPVPPRPARRLGLHIVRLALFALILGLIHLQAAQQRAQSGRVAVRPIALQEVQRIFPAAARLGEPEPSLGTVDVHDAAGGELGYVLQTSPQSDHIVGFSGPTNVLLGFDPQDRLRGALILASGDTQEHVAQVREDPTFLPSLEGRSWDSLVDGGGVDAVSGATLTCLAIQESIAYRLGGSKPSLRFPQPVTLDEAKQLFPDAASLEQVAGSSLWSVSNAEGDELGRLLRTSPAADSIVGYQGPTDSLLAIGTDGRARGLLVRHSYDNEPYVGYVREDAYFLSSFDDLLLSELARLNRAEAGIEGVSGATMTSIAVAEAVIQAAAVQREQLQAAARRAEAAKFRWRPRDWGTSVMILAAVLIGMTDLRSRKWLRTGFQVALIGYLGLINGDLLSQAMLVGWAESGVPWRRAGGLVALTAAALLLPVFTRRNLYCTHLCPHGAAQQLLMKRLPWQLHVGPTAMRWLRCIPALLLVWCVVVPMAGLSFSLVDIEPFDAYVLRVAGWATITVAVVGLTASLFVPMAYCRYGCPTGAVLNFLRFNARSDAWSRRDSVAVLLLMIAAGLHFFG